MAERPLAGPGIITINAATAECGVKEMANAIILFFVSAALCGCQHSGQKLSREYDLSVYRDTALVFHDHFTGRVDRFTAIYSPQDSTYYFTKDTLTEISGTIIIKSEK